ncbi:hypothetical protein Tco_0267820 [Tanacetum coccineum]
MKCLRKIGVYTRFFEYANFRLPLSTFLVNVLRHYRINLSQLLVIAAAKVSHFEILCRVHNIEPTVGLFRCFYINSKNKGWMSFSKRPDSDDVSIVMIRRMLGRVARETLGIACGVVFSSLFIYDICFAWKRIFKKRNKKKAKNKQNQARNGKDKVEDLPHTTSTLVFALTKKHKLQVQEMKTSAIYKMRRFNMDKAKVVSSPLTPNFKLTDKDCPSSKKNIEKMDRVPYASAVGSLMYAMVCTRPDLAHAVGVVSRFLSNPGKKHWEAVKWIFRYLRGTSKLGITFGNGKPMLVGYTDSDLAGNKDNMKSTSGYLMTFAGGAVSWQSRLQKCVALSTTEAEYVAATEACKELLWLKRFLQELGFKQQRYAVLCDNQSTIHLAKNSMFHKRTKHIDIRYHWIRDAIEDGMFELNKVHTDDNASDMLTKAVAREKLKICCSFAGMANSSS